MNQLVGDEHRVGKVVVGSVKGFIQLSPDVGATDVGANTGTLKLDIAICTEEVLLINVAMNEDWQQQVYRAMTNNIAGCKVVHVRSIVAQSSEFIYCCGVLHCYGYLCAYAHPYRASVDFQC